MTSDVAWQLPLAQLLKAKFPSARFCTPQGSVLPAASNKNKSMLNSSTAIQPLQNASNNEEELAFSYAFADLKHGAVIERGSQAQVKEVRIGKPDICKVLLKLAWLYPCCLIA